MIAEVLGVACLVWYLFILAVCAIGVFELKRSFSSRPPPSISNNLLPERVPHVTILRPVKGLEPHLYDCLASTFEQIYPCQKLTIHLCVPSRSDPAFPLLQSLVHEYPYHDAAIFIEDESPNLHSRHAPGPNPTLRTRHALGPNPKIRNMSQGYLAAKGDLIWIIDSNVWAPRSTCAHMVDLLCGLAPASKKHKFVHQLPLVIDTTTSTSPNPLPNAGSLLEELFFSTSHAKFYTAISTVAIAPCIVGKSNMFRRSHLHALTNTKGAPHPPGIDFFSSNICEDHLIGDLLWKNPVPPSVLTLAASEGQSPWLTRREIRYKASQDKWGNHVLVPHCLAIQPMAAMSLTTYLARRTRWLRVRKFTVPLATLVEPGTESLMCSLYGAYGLTSLRICHKALRIPPTWTAFWMIWLGSVVGWMLVDRYVWALLQSGKTFGGVEGEPAFAKGGERKRRRWRERVWAWVGREALALGVWVWAVGGGVEVGWRGRRFKVGWDASVREIGVEVRKRE